MEVHCTAPFLVHLSIINIKKSHFSYSAFSTGTHFFILLELIDFFGRKGGAEHLPCVDLL